jgi:hypothetical protein
MFDHVPGQGLAWAYTLKRFGAGLTLRERPQLPIAASSPTQVLLNDPNRVFWVILNLTPYYGVIAFNDAVTLSSGLMISGVGGYISSAVDEDGEIVTYPVWALSSVPAQMWYVLEITHQ